jgi:hypothetical protein
MALKVLAAGCSQDERERAESDVRRALGHRIQSEAWMVSVVKLQGRWSVTLDGPGVRARTCVAPDGRLSESIREALQGSPPSTAAPAAAAAAAASGARPAPAPAGAARSAPPVSAGPAGHRGDRHECGKCGKAFTVSYESAADEPQERAAVACPHCWHVNHVLIAESAVESRDYRAEKA